MYMRLSRHQELFESVFAVQRAHILDHNTVHFLVRFRIVYVVLTSFAAAVAACSLSVFSFFFGAASSY